MIDLSLDTENNIKTSDIDIVIQQIDLLFDTYPTEVLGEENFGTRYDKFLYNLSVSSEAIRSSVLQDLQSLDLMGFVPDVQVYLFEGTQNDILVINIGLTRDEITYQKTYNISE